MNFDEYATRFRRHGEVARVSEVANVVEGGRDYPIFEASTPGPRTLLVTAGFHGDEVAGPLTLLEALPELVAYASARRVGLRIFPCLNPSGFEDGTRYNRGGEAPNNDLLRYEVAPGKWVDELPDGQPFLRWEVFREGPRETRALLAQLEASEAPAAALDLHQDPWLDGALAYAYTFGPRAAYLPMIEATRALVPIAREVQVDDDTDVHTDADGLIELHDGSVTDYLFRREVRYTAALETTTRTPPAVSREVNLIWLRGFIDLAAREQ